MPTPAPDTAPKGLTFRGALICAVVVLLASTAVTASKDPPITSVRVESIGPADEEAIIDLLELQVGTPLDAQRLREVIMALYAGGDVEWLRVESTATAAGVDVLVQITYRSTISQIKIHAKNPILRIKVQRWSEIKVGDPVTLATIEASRRRVERRLHDRGYADAEVEVYLDFNRKTNMVAVEFEVAAGPQRVVASVALSGLDSEEDAIEARPKVKIGARYTAKLEDRLRARTESNLRKMGFWEAEVVEIERHAVGAEVNLVLRVETGPRYRLDLEAPDASAEIAEKAIPNPAEEELHPAQTEALAEQIQERLQESGYLLAEVRADLRTDADGDVLHVEIDPGRKLRVAAIEFPGAKHLSTRALVAVVAAETGGTGGRFKQRISNATLEADRKAVEERYHREGFPYVVAGRPEFTLTEDESAVHILFPVEEGTRWLMEEVRIEDLPVEAVAEIEERPLELTEGTPWSPNAVERAKRHLEEALADTGYPEGRVESEVDTSVPGRAAVFFRVEPGPFVRVGDVIIAGLRHTRENMVAAVVRRAGVSTGEPLSRRKMLEAQRGLFELGLFRRVELVPMPGQEHREDRNIVVRCEEGEQKSYLFGIGYSNVDAARLILGWSHLNVLGRAYAFSAEASLSRRQQRYSLGLRKQRTFGLPVPGYLAVYRTDEVLADRDLLRRGLWIDFGDRLKRPLRPWFRYEYEIIQPDDLSDGSSAALDDELQESKVASITPSIEWDTRDNPLAPIRGVFASASVQYAFPAFEADNHFIKIRTGGTVYKPILRGFGAAGLRLGIIEPINGDPALPANLQIPFAYRFFGGGRTTFRAVDTDRLGIPGQTIIDDKAVGGNALILINLEYRRRIAGDFFAAIFVDAGNVWGSASQVDFGDIRWGPGIGLQYRTPAGPLRAEYGWNVNHEAGEPEGRFFVSFGVPF
jgi:outer membrane protein insertion porin family